MSSKLSPFAMLQQLANVAKERAVPVPDQAGQADIWQAIAFEFMNETFLVPMKDVKEVLSMPAARRLPGVKKWVKGIANVRGEILALIDLNSFISSGRLTNPAYSRVIAVETEGMRFGVIVDRVIGMRQINQAQVSEGIASSCPSEMRDYVSAAVDFENQDVSLFDPVKLIKSDTFASVSNL